MTTGVALLFILLVWPAHTFDLNDVFKIAHRVSAKFPVNVKFPGSDLVDAALEAVGISDGDEKEDDDPVAAPADRKTGIVNPSTLVDDNCDNVLTFAPRNAPDTLITRAVSLQTVRQVYNEQECVPDLQLTVTEPCRQACEDIKYPTLDGTCNNVNRPGLGAAFTPLPSTLPRNFSHGDLSPARELSILLGSVSTTYSGKFNQMVMQWGQFLTHDILKMPIKQNDPCSVCSDDPDKCLQIPVSHSDSNFGLGNFGCRRGTDCCVREAPAAEICNEEAEFLNENTAFVDASHIYGSSQRDLRRWFKENKSPYLETSTFQGRSFMPDHANCSTEKCADKFLAGDDRVNLFIGLAALHNVFLREHNRIVDTLKLQNGKCWKNEKIFYEARKILAAEMQIITYNEWLPILLGQKLEPYAGYDADAVPQIPIEISAGALRVGHAMIDGVYPLIDANGAETDRFTFQETLGNAQVILQRMDEFVRGMLLRPIRNGVGVIQEVTNTLFRNRDLAAINIARGRELGVPKYSKWREFCKFEKISTFADMAGIVDPGVDLNRYEELSKNSTENIDLYAGILQRAGDDGRNGHLPPLPLDVSENIDLYAGLLLEKIKEPGTMGETTTCLLNRQFQLLRDGDRFWYENDGVFSSDQLSALNSVSLARILCDNLDNMQHIPSEAFRLNDVDSFVACSELPQLDLSSWTC